MTSSNPHRVRFGPFEADLDTHELWKNGVRIKLGGQPFEILALLLRKPGQLVTREELQKELWAEDTFVDFNHGLNAAVNKLRETLADSAEEPNYIETLPRRGYRFVATVETASEANGGSEATVLASARPSTLPPPPPPSAGLGTAPGARAKIAITETGESRRKWPPRRPVIAVVGTGLALAMILVGVVLSKWPVIRDRLGEEAEVTAREAESSRVSTLVPDPASDPAISPDGKLVAFRRNSYAPGGAGIFVTSSESKAVMQLTHHPGDCCPAWSPDGKQLAFMRIATDEYGIYVVSARGGAPRKISHEDPRKKRGELAWTPDGKYIAFSGDSQQGGSQIFVVSVEDSSVHAITEPQGQDRDWGPAFSPDDAQMAFVRGNGAGFPEEVYVMTLNGGPPRQLTNERAAIMGPPTWSEDGESVIFSSTKEGDPALWKVPASGGTATRLEGTGTATWHPVVAKKSGQMVAQKILRSSGVYCLPVEGEPGKNSPTVITATNGRNEGPQLSPDGRRLVFMSDRSGYVEIWASNRDGSSAVQLTNLRGSGTPRWSPDGLWVAFDSTSGGGLSSVWVISSMGGVPRPLVKDRFENLVPSWSHDGKWVYFGSPRSGKDQVWKVPVDGGSPVQVTHDGGFAAIESVDGTTLYFAKSRYDNPELYKMPVAGGAETPFPEAVRPRSWAAWSPTSRGIFFVPAERSNSGTSIDFYDFKTRLVRQISLLDRSPFWLSTSANGKEVFFNQAERDESSIVLVKTK
jgi:Tol biopolymer transport system component/DNA-binding winged helix-turn-helix (wHTH) protein